MVDVPAAFSTPEDIANRALQHLGVRRITSFQEASQAAEAVSFVYDKVRRAELRRNNWVFSTRRTALRPMMANTTLTAGFHIYTPQSGPNTGTLILAPTKWDPAVLYLPGSIVADPNVQGLLWTSLAQGNIGNTPGAGSVWDVYFGPLAISPYDPTMGYWAGELVYIRDPNSQAVKVYRSLVNGNGNQDIQIIIQTVPSAGVNQTTTSTSIQADGVGNPWLRTEWDPRVTYNRGQIISFEFSFYYSLTEQNQGNIPLPGSPYWALAVFAPSVGGANINWLPIPAEVSSMIAAYPIGAGPVQEANTRNAFLLPNGYLRQAPQDPTQGAVSYLGAPGGLTYSDWVFENGFITSRMSEVILLRFIADVTNVRTMDDMFCEGLAARIAMETCEELTQSVEKVTVASRVYQMTMGEARIVNAIESGSDQPPEDDYIVCRM